MDTTPSPRQLEVLRLYGVLTEQREDWGGALVLICGEGSSASGVSVAVSIAGGTTLVIDADANESKLALRRGELDFVVNTLDEALRALKNEVRQRRPLSVGLTAGTDFVLEEMVERGVMPDLLLVGRDQPVQPILENKSVQTLQAAEMPLWLMNESVSSRQGQDEVYLAAANTAELRSLDERLQAIFPVDDLIRRRWVQVVPQYLRDARSGGRWIWLTRAEQQQLALDSATR